MTTGKKRLDQILVDKGFISSRERAKRCIMAGMVYVDGEKVDKPGQKTPSDKNIYVKEDPLKYVSRGGLKLEKGLEAFKVDINDRIAIDVGASTGGFTDCLLQVGARHVHAVDVGYGQFAWKLRKDDRVSVYERTNIRHVDSNLFEPIPTLATVDVSFISLKLIIPKLVEILDEPKEMIMLIKPQFEVSRDKIGKNGVVKDRYTHIDVLQNILEFSLENNLEPNNITYSPIKGPKGNIEYLIHLLDKKSNKNNYNRNRHFSDMIAREVKNAHEFLKGGSL
ncbi:TlyA family RNA methyltransferase [Natranaerobius trueperi]|uniref:TlyA family rRNA (Cytidine-2'-O)-methyltransferase n=1 Tax=Natranaerobius trueperi TaxID=759412 RepID=A0A226BYK3_9FIRM|nr:TlyA family RNA methyltransferase [Natranaerobius trueperi]OWZ84011.1 TlyA family rRNA (cytidine-2'-O)-methyltransferase [Natranaerobius trueperi]